MIIQRFLKLTNMGGRALTVKRMALSFNTVIVEHPDNNGSPSMEITTTNETPQYYCCNNSFEQTARR
ncbi:MAG: hypothetical protein ACOYL3_09110 [Desulfuromonadaceae bacterium]